jgi:hypothetical protein
MYNYLSKHRFSRAVLKQKTFEASFNVYDAALTTTDEIVRIEPRRIGNDYNPRCRRVPAEVC